MSCEARHNSQPVNWILPPGMSNRAFSGFILIDWITWYAAIYHFISIYPICLKFHQTNILLLVEVYHLAKHHICSIHGMKTNRLR